MKETQDRNSYRDSQWHLRGRAEAVAVIFHCESANNLNLNQMISLDFFSKAPPGEATRWIVKRYTEPLVIAILQDIHDFSLKTVQQHKSLCQLYNVILCVEGDIKPFSEKILKNVIYKLILDDEPAIRERAQKIAELLGLFVSTDFILPMLLAHLNDIESRSVPRFVSSCLTALSAVIVYSSKNFGN